MDIHTKKKLIRDVNKLSVKFHEQIFEKILTYYINKARSENNNSLRNINEGCFPNYNSTSTATFIDLADIDDELIKKLIDFVELCNSNIKYDKEWELLYQKAKENVDELYTNDYTLNNIMSRSNGIKII